MQHAFSFDRETVTRIGKGALIAGAGAGIVAVLQYVGAADFGDNSAIVGAVCAILVNVVREFVKGV